jgi:hypothetical protein
MQKASSRDRAAEFLRNQCPMLHCFIWKPTKRKKGGHLCGKNGAAGRALLPFNQGKEVKSTACVQGGLARATISVFNPSEHPPTPTKNF